MGFWGDLFKSKEEKIREKQKIVNTIWEWNSSRQLAENGRMQIRGRLL